MLLISNYIPRNYTLFTLSGISGGIDVGEGNMLKHDVFNISLCHATHE